MKPALHLVEVIAAAVAVAGLAHMARRVRELELIVDGHLVDHDRELRP